MLMETVMSNVKRGTTKTLITSGVILVKNFLMYEATQIAKIEGITVER